MKNIFVSFILIMFTTVLGIKNVSADATTKTVPKKITTYQVPVLVYHSVAPVHGKKESAMQLHYRVNPETFEKQMKYLAENGYHPISFSNYAASLISRNKLPEKAIVITFDDGWKNQYDYAVPVLEKYKFPATFFIITSYSEKDKAYMSWDNLKNLVTKGFDIGSHTVSHPILTKIDLKKINKELSESKKTLEDKLGIKITTLAYPYYMQNLAVRNALKSAGYLGARAGWSNFTNSLEHIYELKSQEVVNNPNPFSSKRLSDLP